MFPQLAQYTDFGLLLLRLMVAAIYLQSGWSHATNSQQRSKDIGMSQGFTIFLGTAELAGGLGVAFGVLTQLAVIGLILINLGAIQKQIFVWHVAFWGEKTYGWHYDVMMIVMDLVILFTNGGHYSLMNRLG
jgi:putative oxidoreductase